MLLKSELNNLPQTETEGAAKKCKNYEYGSHFAVFFVVWCWLILPISSQWCHNEHDGVSNHQPHDCLLNCLFRCRSKKTSKLRATGLCKGNSPVTSEFPSQRASNAENVSIWWRHHVPQSFHMHCHWDNHITTPEPVYQFWIRYVNAQHKWTENS